MYVLAGLIMASPASLLIGISTAAHPELNGPIQPMTSSSCAADWAFSAHLAASHWPACAVASSIASYSMLMSPALPSRSCSASLMALTMVVVWALLAPATAGRSLSWLWELLLRPRHCRPLRRRNRRRATTRRRRPAPPEFPSDALYHLASLS